MRKGVLLTTLGLILVLPLSVMAASLPVKVCENSSGNVPVPVAGVKVEAFGGFGYKALLASGVSGTDGGVTLGNIPIGKEILVKLSKSGYVTQYDARSYSDLDVDNGVVYWVGSVLSLNNMFASIGNAFDSGKSQVYLEVNDEMTGSGVEGIQFSVTSGTVYELGQGDYLIANAQGTSLKVNFGKPGYAFDIESLTVPLFTGGMTQYYVKLQSGGAMIGSPMAATVTSVQVFGFIKTVTGAPISGASVAFTNYKGQAVRPTVSTKSDGYYKQTEVPARKIVKITPSLSPFKFKAKSLFIGTVNKQQDFVAY